MNSLDAQLAGLERLSSAELRERWVALAGGVVPRLALAWEIQARALGGLPREVTRQLEQLARGATSTAAARPGMRLVRAWAGKVHVVTIEAATGGEGQVIRWDDREWRSLSEVARAITGTRWLGPAFVGLTKKVAA